MERQDWFLLDQQARYDTCSGHEINLFFLLFHCLPLPRCSILISRIPCLPLPPLAFPLSPCHHADCLLSPPRSLTRLWRWVCRISATILRILGRPRRLLRRDPPSGHRWELPILHYHGIVVIYPCLFLVVITQFSSE